MSNTSSNRLAIIASHGTLDMAYPPLILATAAIAMDMEAAIFFTFFGLEILKKGRADHLLVAPVPNVIGMLPGMTAVATGMMNSWMKKAKVAKLSELIDIAIEGGVRMIACQMTMDVMGIKKEDLIGGIEVGGAATFLSYASENAMTMSF
jgi:peroxiredoxin family protein